MRFLSSKLLVWGISLLLTLLSLWLLWRADSAGVFAAEFLVLGRLRHFAEPSRLLLLGLLPLLLPGLVLSLTGLSLPQRLLSVLLRAAFLAVLVLGLARPLQTSQSAALCPIVLADVSDSLGEEALARADAKIKELDEELRQQDAEHPLVVLAFGERVQQQLPLPGGPDAPRRWPKLSDARQAAGGRATDIGQALRLAAAWTPTDCLPRYLLLSDGIETRGQAAQEVALARSRGVRLSTWTLAERPASDVAVVAVEIPDGVRVGETFELRVELSATRPASGTLRLYQGEAENGLGGRREIQLEAGQSTEVFESVVRVKGEISYRAVFEAQTGQQDALPQNNEVSASLEVPGPPRVLVVDSQPAHAAHLADALVAQQFDASVRAPEAFPRSRAELAEFSFVILSDLPRSKFGRESETLLIDYVRRGGGLLYAGGEGAYGPGGWQGSALSRVLPVRMDSEKDREVPGVAMSLVIDRSGSMTGLPLQMAKEACLATLSVLDPSDLLEIVAFDSRPKRLVRMQPARYRSRVTGSLMRLTPGGGTEIFNSLDMGYQDLAAIEARKKHIILLTDGNAGSDGIYELASAALADGITITTVGLGRGANQELLRMIAEAGGGRFHKADDPTSLPRIFTRETQLISKEAQVEDWFPVAVARRPEFLQGIALGGAPYLRGFTRTQLGSAPSELILASDTGHPILARRKVGLGWTVAWTSDLKARWAVDWLRWSQFGRFLAQTVRAHQQSDDTEIRPLEVRLEGRELVASLSAYDEEERFDDTLFSSLSARLAGETEALETEFQQVAPGRYEARLQLPDFGAYSLQAVHRSRDAQGRLVPAGVSFSSVSLPYPAEYRKLDPQPAHLRSLANFGQGRVDPQAAEFLSAAGDQIETHEGSQKELLLLGLLLFMLDLFVRRVRLFDRRFRA